MAFGRLEARAHSDTYFDTPDWRFHKAGLSLHIQQSGGSIEGKLKSLRAGHGMLRRGSEIRSLLASEDIQALKDDPGRLGEWVRSLAGTRPLRPLFDLNSTRHPFAVLLDGLKVGEVVLDETSISPVQGSESARLRRVEIYVPKKTHDLLRPFVDDLRRACRLSPAQASRFDAGLLTLDLVPERPPELGPTVVDEAPGMGELGYAVLRRYFSAVLLNEPGARVGEDIEALHDMRVAIRRMRAALVLFEPALAYRSRTVRRELGWIAGRLGEVRDLDIQLEWMNAWSGDLANEDQQYLDDLGQALRRRRWRARRDMLRSLDLRRYDRLVVRIADILRKGPPRRLRAAKAPALAVFPNLIDQRHASVETAGKRIRPNSSVGSYHRLRIRCKRLRYAIESGRDLYGSSASGYLDVLVRIQDNLGEHQDACVARDHLQDLLETEEGRLSTRVIFMMGRASQRYDQTAVKLRKRFPKVYPQVSGKAWIRLKRAMQKRSVDLSAAAWPTASAQAIPAEDGQSGETT